MKSFYSTRIIFPHEGGRRYGGAFVLTLLLAVALWRPIFAAEDPFKTFADVEVPVQVFKPPNTLDLLLIGVLGRDIILRPQGEDLGERIYLPLDAIEPYSLHYTFPKKYREAQVLLREKRYTEGLEQVRSVVYPLIPFLVVPAEKFNIHRPVLDFFEALLKSEGEDEAVAIVRRLPLKRLGSDYQKAILALAQNLAEQKRQQASLEVLRQVPIHGEGFEQSALILHCADWLRERGYLVEALSLYRRLHRSNTRQSVTSLLWIAYCNLIQNRIETARLFLDQVGDLEYTEDVFSLKQLVLGRLYLSEKDPLKALLAVSEGVIVCPVDYAWAAELLYLSGLCYEAMEQFDTARTIYRSARLSFPKSLWAKKGTERLDALSPIEMQK